MPAVENARKGIKNNKKKTIGIIIAVLVFLLIIGTVFSLFSNMFISPDLAADDTMESAAYRGQEAHLDRSLYEQPEFEIRKGSAHIESEDADSEVSILRNELDRFEADITDESRREVLRRLSYTVNVRVRSENFDDFVEWLEETYDVKETEIHYETVSVQGHTNEIRVLEDAMGIYNEMLEDIRSRDRLTSEEMELVYDLTEKRKELAKNLNELGYDIEELEEQERWSEVEIRFEQDLQFSVWPEDVWNDVRDEFRSGLDDLTDTLSVLARLPIDIINILLSALRYALFIVTFLLPFVAGIFLLKGAYRKFVK